MKISKKIKKVTYDPNYLYAKNTKSYNSLKNVEQKQ